MTNRELREKYEGLVRQRENDSLLYSWNTRPQALLSIFEKTEPKSIKVLELGCGRGHLSAYQLARGFNVIASDFNIVSLSIGQKIYPKLTFICADAEEMSFRDEAFDVVISVELIEHLPHLDRHLGEIRRVLKKGGRYYLTTPNRLVENIYNLLRKKTRDELHLSTQSMLSLKQLMVENGFTPRFYPSGRLTSAQSKKIGCGRVVSALAEKLPLKIVPKAFQPSLTCVASKI